MDTSMHTYTYTLILFVWGEGRECHLFFAHTSHMNAGGGSLGVIRQLLHILFKQMGHCTPRLKIKPNSCLQTEQHLEPMYSIC